MEITAIEIVGREEEVFSARGEPGDVGCTVNPGSETGLKIVKIRTVARQCHLQKHGGAINLSIHEVCNGIYL